MKYHFYARFLLSAAVGAAEHCGVIGVAQLSVVGRRASFPPTNSGPLIHSALHKYTMSPSGSYLELQAEIDVRVRALQQQILDLKSERNLLSPISKFPPEILTTIFECLRVSSTKGFRCETYVIKASGVCRRWRHIALAEPRLWTRFDMSRVDQFHDTLERAKDAALWVDYSYRSNNELLREVMNHPAGFRTLCIAAEECSDMTKELLNTIFCRLGPQFRTLVLNPYSEKVPMGVFPQIGPNLHYLTLVRCEVDWNSLFASNATNLSYLYIGQPRTLIDVDQLLAFLKPNTHLHFLKLNYLLHDGPAEDLDVIAPHSIELPNLEVLHLRGSSIASDLALLSALRYPNDTKATFHTFARNGDSIPALMDAIAKGRDNPDIVRLKLRFHWRTAFHMETWSSGSPKRPTFCVAIRTPPTYSDWASWFPHLTRLPLLSLQELYLKSDEETPPTGLISILREIPELHTLELEGVCARPFLTRLKVLPQERNTEAILPFRRLEKLAVIRAFIGIKLCKILKEREELYGLKLKELHYCGWTELVADDVHKLKKLIKNAYFNDEYDSWEPVDTSNYMDFLY